MKFPFWRILFGLDEPNQPPDQDVSTSGEERERMYEVEALNITLQTKSISKYAGDPAVDFPQKITQRERKAYAQFVVDNPDTSNALRTLIKTKILSTNTAVQDSRSHADGALN